jgi:hypothetical protein
MRESFAVAFLSVIPETGVPGQLAGWGGEGDLLFCPRLIAIK